MVYRREEKLVDSEESRFIPASACIGGQGVDSQLAETARSPSSRRRRRGEFHRQRDYDDDPRDPCETLEESWSSARPHARHRLMAVQVELLRDRAVIHRDRAA